MIQEKSPGLYRGDVKEGDYNLNEALDHIKKVAEDGDEFHIVLGTDTTIEPVNFDKDYSAKNVNIIIKSDSSEKAKTVKLTTIGAMFTLSAGVTLILNRNIILEGLSMNNTSLIKVLKGSRLVVNEGLWICGNTAIDGGGVYVGEEGKLVMNGGIITGNKADYGGGIYVSAGGKFTLYGGKIENLTTYMHITDNRTIIYENTASVDGGSIFVSSDAVVAMNGGEIIGNMAHNGGGVFVATNGRFTMHGGKFDKNVAESGGGVFVDDKGTFKKESCGGRENSGIICGVGESGVLENNAARDHSSAIFVSGKGKRNTTVGETDTIDSTTGEGLSETFDFTKHLK